MFSKSTADAIRLFFPNDSDMLALAEFIEQVDSWFDTMNSRKEIDPKKPLKCGFGVHYIDQKKVLDDFIATISNLKVKGKKSLMPWQHGIITTSNAIMMIFEFLRDKFGIKYILTSRFNQDALENLFGQLRFLAAFQKSFGALKFMQLLRD